MSREEARKRLEVYLICAQCPEDKECYDSYLHSTCEYNDCREEVSLAEAIRTAIKALEQEPVCIGKVEFDEDKLRDIVKEQIRLIAIQKPCEDVISRADAIDACEQSYNLLEAVDRIKEL